MLTHVWIRRRAGFGGYAHAGVFYGFLVLFAGTVILAFQDDFAEPVLGWTFWEGAFYKGYSLFLDLFGVALRDRRRLLHRAPVHDAAVEAHYGAGDWAFIGLLFFLALSGFALEALRIAIDQPDFEVWAPVGLRRRQRPARRRPRTGDGRDAAARHVVGARHRGARRSWRRSRARRRCT